MRFCFLSTLQMNKWRTAGVGNCSRLHTGRLSSGRPESTATPTLLLAHQLPEEAQNL